MLGGRLDPYVLISAMATKGHPGDAHALGHGRSGSNDLARLELVAFVALFGIIAVTRFRWEAES